MCAQGGGLATGEHFLDTFGGLLFTLSTLILLDGYYPLPRYLLPEFLHLHSNLGLRLFALSKMCFR